MKERKTVDKWWFVWDYDKEEKWLNDMARQGWVLDFGAEIIYKRRTEQVLKEAV